jgi:hypothetical protein
MKYPTKKEITALVKHVKSFISNEYRAFDGDEVAGIQLTVGHTPETGEWDYQTGDNSYSGRAYFHRNWAVVGVYKNSNCKEVASDILEQLKDYEY